MPGPDIVSRIDSALEQPSELDRLVLGPDAAYSAARAEPAAEPSPEPSPRPPRQPARRKGPVETATAKDLKALPPSMRAGTLAATALQLARDLDEAAAYGMTHRDKAGHARELRMHMTQLFDSAPGGAAGDATDEVRERRERRLAAASD